MGKKQYMEILLGQIRNKKARDLVSEEIEAHIDDQTEAYRQQGMKDRDAEYKAVCEMGDPVETGVSLDRVHKPQISWGMIVLIGVINVIGIIILSQFTSDIRLVWHQVFYAAVGFAVMILICMLDYTWIGKWCGVLSLCFLGVYTYIAFSSGWQIGLGYIYILGRSVSLNIFAYFSILLFASLLYRYRKRSWCHMLIPTAFMIVVIFLFASISYSVMVTLNLILLSAVVISFAVAKGWYPVKKKIFLGVLWGSMAAVPGFILFFGMRFEMFASYQIARIENYLSGNYVIWGGRQFTARTLIADSQWIGQSPVNPVLSEDSMRLACDYMILNVISYYGILALLAVIGLFAFLFFRMIHISLRQRNQFGMIMGLSCSLILGTQIFEYVMMNLGFLPPIMVYLPLFSYGGSGTVFSYLLLGILLSIYRYQNLVKEQPMKRPKFRLRIERLPE